MILSEPSNPWVGGVSGLFTTESYARVRGYLTDDGVLGQWIHTHELDDRLVLRADRGHLAALPETPRVRARELAARLRREDPVGSDADPLLQQAAYATGRWHAWLERGTQRAAGRYGSIK